MKNFIIVFILLSLSQNLLSKEMFTLASDKKIIIQKGDITKSPTQAIVNAANSDLVGGAGVCGAIFQAAGWDKLQHACDAYKQKGRATCPTGQARITDSFNLKNQGIKYIIHAVGPDCRIITDATEQDELLAQSYKNSLQLAEDYRLETIAFPFISSAIYAFPKQRASRIALKSCIKMLKELDHVKEVHFILFSQEDYDLFLKTMKLIKLVM